mmetsp:Transcript_23435/g.43584  ORF Transcript_23435/g.43584 Transcript_23435/m.43584 type:complete len:374 (-) Transcript_23435:37-1158(-)
MGNLQSALSDCQFGNVPAYLQQFVNKSEAGDEAYMVYGERAAFQPGVEEAGGLYYSGPSQQHVHRNLLRENGKSKEELAEIQKKALSELVDLCVDGIDSSKARATPPIGSEAPGGKTFVLPQGKEKHIHSQIWSEAEQDGALRVVDPAPSAPRPTHKSDLDVEVKVKRKGTSKKKKKKAKAKGTSKTSDQGEHTTASKVKDSESRRDEDSDPNTNGDMYDSQLEDSGNSSNERDVSPPPTSPRNQKAQPSAQNSPSRSDTPKLAVCRDEEAQLLGSFTVVVHPSEVPDDPPQEWYLVEAGWFREWSAFLRGAPRPGKINNGKLVNTSRQNEAWPDQKPGKHYVGMDHVAWNLLKEIYGADLAVVRKVFDIYSQ